MHALFVNTRTIIYDYFIKHTNNFYVYDQSSVPNPQLKLSEPMDFDFSSAQMVLERTCSELSGRHGSWVCRVSSTVQGNVSTVSAQVVYTLSTKQGGV